MKKAVVIPITAVVLMLAVYLNLALLKYTVNYTVKATIQEITANNYVFCKECCMDFGHKYYTCTKTKEELEQRVQ